MLICFDIDGTLADNHHRINYVKTKPKNWAAFDAGIPHDKVNTPVAEVFWALRARSDIIFCSGRSERSRQVTETWLKDNDLWQDGSKLYMRKDDDYRSDDIVKDELIDVILEEHGKLPDMWFDDRPRVVKAVRARGIFVFDVYQGEEDF